MAPLAMMHAFAQQPKFDLADVHISKTPRWFAQNNGGMIRDGRHVNRNATLLNLIEADDGVKEDEVAGSQKLFEGRSLRRRARDEVWSSNGPYARKPAGD